MDRSQVRALLQELRDGTRTVEEALEGLGREPYDGLDYATVDFHRALRTGVPEVVYGEGKTAAQVAGILDALRARGQSGLATRVDATKAAEVLERLGGEGGRYHATARVLELRVGERPALPGRIALVSAGTSDQPVVEEAAVVAEVLGAAVDRYPDIGVAGLHRLLRRLEELRRATVVIVVAGMDGALPGVVGGLVEVPVIAVPTSVGYGAAFGGLAPLLTMLNACAAGVSVVNIDNGYGAACQAVRILRLVGR